MATKKVDAKKTDKKVSKKLKVFKSPSAFSVLFIIIAIMAGLTWLIPSGRYEYTTNEKGESSIKSGSYTRTEKRLKVVEEVKDPKNEISASDAESKGYKNVKKDYENAKKDNKDFYINLKQGFWDIFTSPIYGMVNKLDVIVFVLILGGFLGVVMKTGALDASIGGLLKKMKGKEKWLIPVLMTLFAIGGTTYGMQEEAVAFYALVVPIMLAAGYNAMTAVMVIVLGAGVGVLASTVNPFSTGIAANAAGADLSKVLLPQFVILVVSLIASIIFTMRYAGKVKAGGYAEDSKGKPAVKAIDASNIPKFTLERKFVMGIFGFTFLVMVMSLIPWEDLGVSFFKEWHEWLATLPVVGPVFGFEHSVAFGSWYFNEISALFLISTVLIKILYYEEFKKEDISVTNTFLAGSADLLNVALIIAVAAAIGVLMRAGGIQDTIVYWGEDLLRKVPSQIFGVLAFIFYIPMSFIIPSSSGLAEATMPIIAPVASLAGSTKEIAVVAFATASGLLNMIAPTIASLMAGLALAGVPYKNWVKRTAPIMAILTIISLVVIIVMGFLK